MVGVKYNMDLSSSGVVKFRGCVKEKLFEYIGNYIDDVFVVWFLFLFNVMLFYLGYVLVVVSIVDNFYLRFCWFGVKRFFFF